MSSKTTARANKINQNNSMQSSVQIEASTRNDIAEVLDELVVTPVVARIPDCLAATESKVKLLEDKLSTMQSQMPSSSVIAFDVKNALLNNDDLSQNVADAISPMLDDAVKEITDDLPKSDEITEAIGKRIDDAVEEIKDDLPKSDEITEAIFKRIDDAVSKIAPIASDLSVLIENQNGTKMIINALIEEVMKQDEQIQTLQLTIKRMSGRLRK